MQLPPAGALSAALDELRAVTPYFELRHGPGAGSAGRPLADLREPAVAHTLFDEAAAALGSDERRVAVSWVFLDLAAHLWSVALGTALLTGRSVELDPGEIRFTREGNTTVLHTAAPRPGGRPLTEVIDRQLEPLVRAWGPLAAPGLLWGNAASCLVTAGGLLAGASITRTSMTGASITGAPAGSAEALVDEALADPRLADTLEPGSRRRRSCCLFYRGAVGGYCGDCALTRR